ncbi:hypothetical protein V2J09_002907 [Rumex salicifolius]
MAVSNRRSSGPVLRTSSPCGRFSNPRHMTAAPSTAASAFASSTSTFASRPTSFFRSASPTRVNMYNNSPAPSASAVRFAFDRPTSPGRSIAAGPPRSQVVQRQGGRTPSTGPKRTCMCSPTTHPGSFRCSLHKNNFGSHHGSAAPYQSNRLNARRSAMTNSLVRIGTVEGDLVKRALAALIRPSSHQQRRRTSFQARPSRLSVMSKAENS